MTSEALTQVMNELEKLKLTVQQLQNQQPSNQLSVLRRNHKLLGIDISVREDGLVSVASGGVYVVCAENDVKTLYNREDSSLGDWGSDLATMFGWMQTQLRNNKRDGAINVVLGTNNMSRGIVSVNPTTFADQFTNAAQIVYQLIDPNIDAKSWYQDLKNHKLGYEAAKKSDYIGHVSNEPHKFCSTMTVDGMPAVAVTYLFELS